MTFHKFPYDDYPDTLKAWLAVNMRGPWMFQAYSEDRPESRVLLEGCLVGPGLLLILARTPYGPGTPGNRTRGMLTACLSAGGTSNAWADTIADLDRQIAAAMESKWGPPTPPK